MRTYFTSALLFSFTAVLWCQPSGLPEAEQHQNRAAFLLLNGDFEGAILQLEAAAGIYKAAEEWEYYFSCLNQSTNAYLNIGKLDEAKRNAKKALWESIQRLGRDNDEAAKAAHRLAEVYSRAGRHAKALEVHKMGLMIRKSIYGERHTRLADSYDWLAGARAAAADYEQAADYYERAMSLRKDLLGPQHPDIAVSYANLAKLEVARENYPKALTHFQTAYSISMNRLGDKHPDVAATLASMARLNRRLGEEGLAAEQYRQAAILYRQSPNVKGELAAEAFYELANQYFEEGRLSAARPFAKAAVQAFPPGIAASPEDLSRYHHLLGAIHMEMGEYEAAAGSFQQALDGKQAALSASCYEQWSEALRLSGDYPAALEAATGFLEWAEEEGIPYSALKASAQLGRLLIETGQVEAGVRQLGKALSAKDIPFWLFQEAAYSLGDAYRIEGAYEQAIQQFKTLAEEWEKSRQPGALFFRFRALLAMGAAHSELAGQDRNTLYNLEAALDAFRACDKLFAELILQPLPAEQLAFLVEGQSHLYGNAIGACYSLYQQNQGGQFLKEAFYFSERSKQLELSLPLLLLPPASFSRAPRPLLEQEATYKREVQFLFRKLKNNRFQAEIADSIQSEIEKKEEAYRSVLAELEQAAPEYYRLKFGGAVASPSATDGPTEKGEAVLYSYYIDGENLYIFHLSGAGLQLFRRPLDEELRTGIRNFIQVIQNVPEAGAPEVRKTIYKHTTTLAVELYQKLFPGSFGPAGGQVFLSPHGILQWLPFEALLPEAASGKDFATLPYLGVAYTLSYHHSATTLMDALRKTPALDYASPFEAFAFEQKNKQVAMNGGYGLNGSGAGPFRPFAEFARSWAGENNGNVWEGAMANEDIFRKIPSARVLLLALHANVGPLSGETFITFAGNTDSLSVSRLYLKEAYGLNKPAELAILASILARAPESAGWEQLAEALRYSGSRSLLLHRWRPAGAPSSELLGLFMNSWQLNGNVPESIQKARRDYLARQADMPENAHPHFWAGYAAYGAPGEGRPATGIPRFLIIAAVAGLILIGWLVRLN